MANNNFCVWSSSEEYGYLDISLGGCKLVGNTSADASGANTTMGFNSGKWYSEYYMLSTGQSSFPYLSLSSGNNAEDPGSNTGFRGEIRFHAPNSTGMDDNTGSTGMTDNWGTVTLTETGVTAATNGDVIGFALDLDNKKLFISKNGTYYNSGNPATGTNPQATWTTNPERVFINGFCYTSGRGWIGNWGQDSSFSGNKSTGTAAAADGNGFGDFYYSPPSGFLAMCSCNQPISSDIDPAGDDGDTQNPTNHFGVVTFDGNGTTNAVTGLGFKPDLIWGFTRSHGQSKRMVDSSRGGSSRLYSDSTQAATGTNATIVTISEFGTDGFTSTGTAFNNDAGRTCGSWCWKANGGTTSTNTSGTVTSTVQANTIAGFSIVQYAGTLSSTGVATVGHGLSAAPEFYMIKNPDKNGRWFVWHTAMSGANYMLELNSSAAQADKSGNGNMSLPTSTVFSTNYTEGSNENPYNHIAYVWHGVEGYSKFGSYIGNGNTNGPTFYTGFRPRLIFIKNISGTSGWTVVDTNVYPHNTKNGPERAEWQSSTAAVTGTSASREMDLLSNGVKINTTNSNVNTQNSVYIFGAWADVPFKYANSR